MYVASNKQVKAYTRFWHYKKRKKTFKHIDNIYK